VLSNCLLASRMFESLRAEEQLRDEQIRLLEERLAVGEIARPEVDAVRIELAKIHLAVIAAQDRLAESRVALAASIAVPVEALQDVDLNWSGFDSPPDAHTLPPPQMRRDAVVNRLDVRRALARYAAAEADLQLEISKQYPDLQLGPGYTYEEGNNFFSPMLSLTLPVFNRNQGPIAEAEARRKQSAAAFLQTQAQVIAESETSLAHYTAAVRELNEADGSLHTLRQTRLQSAQKAVEAGEQDRLALQDVQVEAAVLARERLDVLARAQSALGELEDALQRPLDPGDAFPVASATAAAASSAAASANQPSGHPQKELHP
jgi:outer membrane protein, heavy metal efflux system